MVIIIYNVYNLHRKVLGWEYFINLWALQWGILIRSSGLVERYNVSLCNLTLDVTSRSGFATEDLEKKLSLLSLYKLRNVTQKLVRATE
jgi:hypothetical protein